ncbi:MAG TPA: LysM peptidoglycan-binding domain-containing protein [Puia sp.]
MKSLLTGLFCLIGLVSSVLAQHPQLRIEGTNGKFYLVHTIAAKDNWYSIGRLYNASPHDIASYNNLSFDKPLEIGQLINIPLNATNFDQKQKKNYGETLIPVYHLVQEKEWAFRLSSIYNDVPVTSLEKWNKIKRDDVKQGMLLVVGFLKVKTDQSPLASEAPAVPEQPGSVAQAHTEKPAETKIVDQPAQASSNQKTLTTSTVSTTSTGNTERPGSYAATHAAGGFFSVNFIGNNNKSVSGQAGTFKSTSGWTDGKYYALMNGVAVGTIVRISSNGKSVYAKVLGQLPDMKESNGLVTRISNAAAAELGTGENRFPVDVKY